MKKIGYAALILILLTAVAYLARPRLTAYFYNQGVDYYDRGLDKEAVGVFTTALKIDASRPDTHYALAASYEGIKEYDKARAEYERALELNPVYAEAYIALSHIYMKHRRYKEAIELLKRASLKLGNNNKIEKTFKEAKRESAVAYLNEGIKLLAHGNRNEARLFADKALEVMPNFAEAHYILGHIYYIDGEYDQANSSLEKALRVNPEFWLAHKLLGDAYYKKGDYERALSSYKAALSFNQDDPFLYNDIGMAMMQMEFYNESVLYMENAARLAPGNSDILYNLGGVYKDNKMYDKAVSVLKRLLKQQADYPNAHNKLADIYTQQGKDEPALFEYSREIRYADEKLSVEPGNAALLNNLAYAYSGAGQHKKALKIITGVILRNPDYRDAYLTLARIHEKLGNYRESTDALNKARSLSGSGSFIERDIVRLKKVLGERR